MDVKAHTTNPRNSSPNGRRGQALLTCIAGVTLIAGAGALSLAWWDQSTPAPEQHSRQHSGDAKNSMFRNWGKPELAIVLTGQQHGYLQPCGCSRPQYGGLARRFNFMQSLKKKGWQVAAVDLGDLAQHTSPQRSLKYQFSMKALRKLNYAAIGVGIKEMNMSLFNALAEYSLNNPEPSVVAANILTPKTEQVIRDLVKATKIVKGATKQTPSLGIIGLVGKAVIDKTNDPDVDFAKNNAAVIQNALKELQGTAHVSVLLYQGTVDDAKTAAKYCAGLRQQNPRLPNLDVILCLSREEEPPSTPVVIKEAPHTMIISVGHKGRYVGVVGFFRTNVARQPYSLKYQLVSIGENFETPKGQEHLNPIMAMMEDYAKEVKNGNYIVKYPVVHHPVQAQFPASKYVGTKRCRGCHPDAYQVWKNSAHSHAYATLENKAIHPSMRQYDGECVKCHVVGFSHPTGYMDALKNNDNEMIRRLQDVGCESCHGPGSEHVKKTEDLKIRRAINPWKALANETEAQRSRRMLKIDVFCQNCHDTDNDVHWNFAKKWPKVIHMTPRSNAAQQPNAAPAAPPAAGPRNVTIPPPPQRERRFQLNPLKLIPRRK